MAGTAINLSQSEVDVALPKVGKGLGQYIWLQNQVATLIDFHLDATFRRRFNHFYRVRNGKPWQDSFYGLMGRGRNEHLNFSTVLAELSRATNRIEASFASKLVATLDPTKPVIDAFVLKNVGLRLPLYLAHDRMEKVCAVYDKLIAIIEGFEESEDGNYLLNSFRRMYPDATISNVKMIDLVLWQSRK
ncbi:MAG: hypothetical protein WD768_08755 [Phycisphaeraceae bacterium]